MWYTAPDGLNTAWDPTDRRLVASYKFFFQELVMDKYFHKCLF